MKVFTSKKLWIIFSIAFFISSCTFVQPTFSGFNIKSMKPGKEGEFIIEAEIKVDNPNKYAIWLKKGNMDILMKNAVMGNVKTKGVTIIKGNSNDYSKVKLKAKLDQGGALLGLISGFSGGGSPKLQFKGDIRAGVFIVGKKFDVDFSDKLPSMSIFGQ